MSSVVHYRFQNASKKWDSVVFEGTVISVLDVKRAIVQQKKLDKGSDDFDLALTDVQTGEGK